MEQNVGSIVERLIFIKDHNDLSIQDRDAISAACNILDHCFQRYESPERLIDEHIISIHWYEQDIVSALCEHGFVGTQENIAVIMNSEKFARNLQDLGVAAGWDVMNNAIAENKEKLDTEVE